MKKLLLFLFCISLMIFDIDVKSENDYYKLIEDNYSFYILNKDINIKYLIDEFDNDIDVSLISIKIDDIDGFIRLEDSNLEKVKYKIIDRLGLEEENMKQLANDYIVSGIKVYGKNSEIYKLISDLEGN